MKLLIIEDDHFIQKAYQKVIQEKIPGTEITCAETLEQAKKSLAERIFDVIIADYLLPDGTSLELLIKKPSAPVIFITGAGSEQVAVKAMKLGAYDYLVKTQSKDFFSKLPKSILSAYEYSQRNAQIQQLSSLVEQSPSMFMVSDPQCRIQYVNHRYCQVSGYLKEEMIHQPCDFLQSKKNSALSGTAEIQNFVKQGDIWRGEFLNQKKDGSLFWEWASISCIRNQEGQVTHYIKTAEDITLKKLLEEQVYEREKLYRLLAENSTDVISKHNPEGCFVFASPAIVSLTGYTPEEVLGKRASTFFHEQDRERVLASYHSAFTIGSENTVSYRFHKKDGNYLWVETTSKFICDPQTGKILEMVAVTRDISLRKQTEEQLQKSEAFYKAIVEDQTEMICRFLPDGTLTFVNDAYCRNFKKSRDELLGKNLIPLILKEDREQAMDHLKSFSLEKPLATFEQRVEGLDGTLLWQQWTDRAIFDENHSIIEFQSVGTDITRIKKAEMAVKKAYLRLEEMNQNLESRVEEAVHEIREKDKMLVHQSRQAAMGEMIENIAHQWKQPLNQLGLLVQSLSFLSTAEEFKASVPELIQDSMKVIQHMAATIDDFKNFFKPEKIKNRFPLKTLVEKVLTLMGGSLSANRIQVTTQISSDLSLEGYSNEYAQVVLNLLNNAKDVLRERKISNPLIQIKGYSEGQHSVLTIEDNGGGIPEILLPKIFSSYFTTKTDGTGLGLHLSKKIIEENMNGSLTFQNTAQGALFKIQI